MSEPNQYSAEGCLSRLSRVRGAAACGSTVPSQGARIAMPIMTRRITPPAIAVGWRRNAALKRSQSWTFPSLGEAAMSVADARIEQRIAQVHDEVDEHVGAREDEHHPLDDRIVASQDRVHREPADARDREHGLGHDRAPNQERDAD